MFHSEILVSWNFNKDEKDFPWIGEHPYTEMLFCQFSNIIVYVRGEKTRSTFECVVIIQSTGQGPDSWKYGTDLSHSSPSFLGLVPWIWKRPYIKILILYFSNNLDKYDYVGKLPEQHFSVWLFFNPGDNILFLLKFNEARISKWNICLLQIIFIFVFVYQNNYSLHSGALLKSACTSVTVGFLAGHR